jgi:hypothetical protein
MQVGQIRAEVLNGYYGVMGLGVTVERLTMKSAEADLEAAIDVTLLYREQLRVPVGAGLSASGHDRRTAPGAFQNPQAGRTVPHRNCA